MIILVKVVIRVKKELHSGILLKGNHTRCDMNKGFPTLKWSIFWTVVHSFSVWLMVMLLVSVNNEFVYIILAGLGITIIAKVVRSITRNEPFRLNRDFLLWTCISIFSFWIVRLLLEYAQITEGIPFYLLMGLGIYLIGLIVNKF